MRSLPSASCCRRYPWRRQRSEQRPGCFFLSEHSCWPAPKPGISLCTIAWNSRSRIGLWTPSFRESRWNRRSAECRLLIDSFWPFYSSSPLQAFSTWQPLLQGFWRTNEQVEFPGRCRKTYPGSICCLCLLTWFFWVIFHFFNFSDFWPLLIF